MAGALVAAELGEHGHDVAHVINFAFGADALYGHLGRGLEAGQLNGDQTGAVFLGGDLATQGGIGNIALSAKLHNAGDIGASTVVELGGHQQLRVIACAG